MPDEPTNPQPEPEPGSPHDPDPQADPAPEPQNPEADDVDRTEDVAALRSEAKRRRLQLREVEAERDGLRERLDQTHRAEVERLAAERFADPSDLWGATSLEEMRDEETGLIDTAKATAEMDRVLAEKPHYAKPAPPPEIHHGPRESVEPKKSFGEAALDQLRGRGR